jgi:L-glyceraldehyde 3-phosphate reductase
VTYVAAPDRYARVPYRRCGRSGLRLPGLSLDLWQNFGYGRPLETGRAIVRRAFDLGITHFDLANNYGPLYGSAEENFGRILAADLRPYRDELVISTKAGYDMWPGPYGEWGSRKYLTASFDQSLARMSLDYVDIFYSHRADPDTPLEETMGVLESAVRAGKALYAGISSYSPERTEEGVGIQRSLRTPLLIHQPSYSLLNRWIEGGLLDVLKREGIGCITFSPLAQGLLTDRYVHGIPDDSRAARQGSLTLDMLSEANLARVCGLGDIAQRRGQSLAQMALPGRCATRVSRPRSWDAPASPSSRATWPRSTTSPSAPRSRRRLTSTRRGFAYVRDWTSGIRALLEGHGSQSHLHRGTSVSAHAAGCGRYHRFIGKASPSECCSPFALGAILVWVWPVGCS